MSCDTHILRCNIMMYPSFIRQSVRYWHDHCTCFNLDGTWWFCQHLLHGYLQMLYRCNRMPSWWPNLFCNTQPTYTQPTYTTSWILSVCTWNLMYIVVQHAKWTCWYAGCKAPSIFKCLPYGVSHWGWTSSSNLRRTSTIRHHPLWSTNVIIMSIMTQIVPEACMQQLLCCMLS